MYVSIHVSKCFIYYVAWNAQNFTEGVEDERNQDDDDDDDGGQLLTAGAVFDEGSLWSISNAPGKKLQGQTAPTIRIPSQFRYKITKLMDHSAVIKTWEESLTRGSESFLPQPITSSRLFFSRARSYPTSVMSIIKYDTAREEARQERKTYEDTRGLEVYEVPKRDWRGTSYSRVLEISSKDNDHYWIDKGYMHDPDYIDDPDMIHGASKQIMFGEPKTGPIISSIILFKNPDDLKQNLNEQVNLSQLYLSQYDL